MMNDINQGERRSGASVYREGARTTIDDTNRLKKIREGDMAGPAHKKSGPFSVQLGEKAFFGDAREYVVFVRLRDPADDRDIDSVECQRQFLGKSF
jgi:hypothetical protein